MSYSKPKRLAEGGHGASSSTGGARLGRHSKRRASLNRIVISHNPHLTGLLPEYGPLLPLHGIGVGDSLLLVALVHKKADAWVTSLRVLTDDEIMSMDANRVVSELQDEVARELNSHLERRPRPSGQGSGGATTGRDGIGGASGPR